MADKTDDQGGAPLAQVATEAPANQATPDVYVQQQDPNGLNPSLPPQQFLGQVLDSATGMEKPKGDSDAIQPTSSPVDLVAAQAGAAAAPVAEALLADEAGVLRLPGNANDTPMGLIQKAMANLGFDKPIKTEAEAKSFMNAAYNAYADGKLPQAQFQAAVSKFQQKAPQKFAEGGEATPADTQSAFDSAFSPEAQLPQTAAGLQPQASREMASAVPAHEGVASGPVNVLNPDGQLVSLPAEQVQDALAEGYSIPTPEHISAHIRQQKYGGLGQQAIAGLEGAASAGTFGLSTGAETALGVSPEDIQGRREVNPGTHTVGEIAGLGVSALTGVGEAKALAALGETGAKALGLAAAESTVAKIGGAAAKAAIENAAFAGGDEVSKMLSQDPSQSIESAVADVGLSGLIGAGFGGALGSVNPLWEASMGAKTAGLLKGVAKRLGGIEGQAVATPVDEALQATGLADTIAPEVRSALSADPMLRNAASVLEQTDTGVIGPAFQETLGTFRKDIATIQAETLGTKLEDVASKGEIDKYAAGKQVGDTLAKEFDQKVAPLAKEYEGYSQKFAGKELDPSVADKVEIGNKLTDKEFGNLRKAQKELEKAIRSQDPGAAIEAEAKVADAQEVLRNTQKAAAAPGTIDTLSERLANLASREGWTASPSSDIMREVARVQRELPNLKTLKDLSNYIKQIGENTKSTLPFGQQTPVSRAGGLMKSILRDSEGELIEAHVGGEGGENALAQYRNTQKAYRAAAQLKDAVDDRLGAGGSVAGYGKTVRAMSKQEGEKVLRRLMGTGDADWLATVSQHFPETAQVLRQQHIDQLLAAAKDGDSLSSKKLLGAMDKMSPQARDFSMSPEQQGKIKAAHSILEQLNDKTHNFSNTARTLEKLGRDHAASVLGAIAALSGHNPVLGYLVGHAAQYLGKTIPDAARLSLLKFMGSSKPVSPNGFKAAADVISRVIKGDNLVTKAARNVFTDGDVIPEHKIPTDATLERLAKKLEHFQEDPSRMLKIGGDAAHYMPEHATAMSETSARVASYVNSQRPVTKHIGMLEAPVPPTDIEKDHFNRVLTIAQQPLVVLDHVKNGTILPGDVVALKSMYPKMYDTLVQKLTTQMIEAHTKGAIPYETKMGLSMFFGHPLDPTMTPEGIVGAQPQPKEAPAPGQATQPKHSTAKLGKLPANFQTQQQAAESRRQTDK